MGVSSAIEKARSKPAMDSAARRVWESLKQSEREEIALVMHSGAVGPGKLATLLAEEGVHLGKYFLEKVKSGAV